jgi:hypothetical protein
MTLNVLKFADKQQLWQEVSLIIKFTFIMRIDDSPTPFALNLAITTLLNKFSCSNFSTFPSFWQKAVACSSMEPKIIMIIVKFKNFSLSIYIFLSFLIHSILMPSLASVEKFYLLSGVSWQ